IIRNSYTFIMKIKFSDYAGVCICFLFTAAGIWIWFYPGAFLFGFGFIVLSISLYTKKKAYKNLSTEFASIEIEGGRKFTQSPLIFYSTSVGLFLAGSGTMFFWDQKIGLLICGAVAAAFGAGLVLSKLLGLFGNQFISFEETGLLVGRNGYSFLIHWENIAEIRMDEWNNVPYVFLEIISYENAEDTIESADREKSALKLRKSCIWNQGYFGSSFAFSTVQFGMDTALFFKAIIQYLERPEKREELALRKRIE
ncbi:MAG TPA: hypothetical protein PK683_20605, partial [Leptospiraceae bacterium]|nr:hypothetical protein [Leptospiraceae bacterium]